MSSDSHREQTPMLIGNVPSSSRPNTPDSFFAPSGTRLSSVVPSSSAASSSTSSPQQQTLQRISTNTTTTTATSANGSPRFTMNEYFSGFMMMSQQTDLTSIFWNQRKVSHRYPTRLKAKSTSNNTTKMICEQSLEDIFKNGSQETLQ